MVVDALRRAPAFSTLSDASLAQLQTAVEAQSLKPGALLFSEGDQAGAVYLLQMGSLQVFRRTRDGDDRVFGPRVWSRTSATTLTLASAFASLVTFSPSTRSRAGSSILPEVAAMRFMVTIVPTSTFSWRPPARTTA